MRRKGGRVLKFAVKQVIETFQKFKNDDDLLLESLSFIHIRFVLCVCVSVCVYVCVCFCAHVAECYACK